MKSRKKKKKLVGYIRTGEYYMPNVTAFFIYKRRNKKYGIVQKAKVTIEKL